MNRGKYILIEGGEGSGKTSEQLPRLAIYLTRKNIPFVQTHEPGGTEISEIFRDIVLTERAEILSPQAELFSYLAARSQLTLLVVKPSLEQGKWVICDRGFPSTVAYQSFGNEIDLKLISMLNEYAVTCDEEFIFPDLTFIIDVPVEIGLGKAMKKGADRQESKGIDFHRRVNEGYKRYLEMYPGNSVRVPYIESNPEEMHRNIVQVLEERFGV